MAIFQTTHPKERDVTEKHGITVDEIRFLKKRQHELNIQDSMGNRDPRFWVIRQSKDTLVAQDTAPFDYDYVTLSDENDLSKNVGNLDELFDVIKELAVDGSYQYGVDRAGDGIVVTNEDDGSTFVIRDITEETAALLDDMAGATRRFHVNYMAKNEYVVPDTLFLTHESCEEHLRRYGYNYEPDAHAYAMTADRSPEYEALIRLLRTIDFEILEKAVIS